jgi:dUTP diphosphatase
VSRFYKVEVPEEEMTGTQYVLATDSDYGKWRNFLDDEPVGMYMLAGRIKKSSVRMPKNAEELGFALLRLMQEGLIGMTGETQGPLIKFKKLHEKAVIPTYAKDGDAGADVRSVETVEIYPSQTKMIDLGFAMEIEPGWEVQVRSRSGLAKRGILVTNSPGTIDSGYRGPCKVLLTNTNTNDKSFGFEPFVIVPGDRIAQFVVKRAPQARFEEVRELTTSERGEGGFGSTGVN